MANIFADDARIIEFWLFENNLNAGKASNTLSSTGTIGYDSATQMEGAYSLDCLATGAAYRTDTNLSAGFPLKNGDAVKKFSAAFWVRPENVTSERYFVSKVTCLRITKANSGLKIYWNYTSGLVESWIPIATDSNFFVNGRKYHIGVTIDGIAKTVTIRVWDDYNATATTYTHTFTNELYISTGNLYVGAITTASYINAKVDELVIGIGLTVDDFDDIRQGIFGSIQVISQSSIDSAESFGTSQVNPGIVTLSPTGITSSETFGTTYVKGPLQTISNFYYWLKTTPALTKIIDGIPGDFKFNANEGYYASGSCVGNPIVQAVDGPQHIAPEGFESEEAFGTPSVTPGIVEIYPTGIASAEAFGTTEIICPQILNPDGIASAEAFGTPQVNLKILPEAIVSEEAFGTPTIGLWILPVGIDSEEGVGAPAVLPGAVDVQPSGIDSGEVFGTPTISLFLLPVGIPSQEAMGTPELFPGQVDIIPVGIPSQEAFGEATVLPGPVVIEPTGIPSSETVGAPALRLSVVPTAISSEEYLGIPQINLIIHPASIESGEAVGEPVMGGFVRTIGIPSAEGLGSPSLILTVKPNAIATGETFGTTEAIPGAVWIYPPGIENGEAFGRVIVSSKELIGLVVLEFPYQAALGLSDGSDETVLLLDSSLRMVVNG